MKIDDLRCRTPHTPDVGQVADNTHRAPARTPDRRLRLVELFAIAPGQHDSAVLGHLKCGRTPDAGSRAGDDVRPAAGLLHAGNLRRHLAFLPGVCLDSHQR
jgi:hypothetical protein